MASKKLTESDYQLIKEYFAKFDTDKSGCVTRVELRKGLQQIGRNPTEEDVTELMSELGVKGAIRYKEFENCMRVILEEVDNDNGEELRKAFKVFDKDGNGYVDKHELSYALTRTGEKLTEDEIDDLFARIDVDGDGKIQYEEFVKMVVKT